MSIDQAISRADGGRTKLPPEVFSLWGQSSPKVRILLNELCSDAKRYLEIGSWRGSTLASAAWGNSLDLAVGVDNWSQFEGDQARAALPEALKLVPGAYVIEGDCMDPTTAANVRGAEVFFLDGPHRREETSATMLAWDQALADHFILVVDDWNEGAVRDGYADAIERLPWEILRAEELPARHNGDKEQYWNGLLLAEVKRCG